MNEVTATNWMRYLGFDRVPGAKGFYTDGHERADVVAYRVEFLNKMAEYEARMASWSGDEMETFCRPCQSDQRRVVLVTHDEMIVHANDATKFFWQEHGSTKSIRPKSNGSSLMVSGFSCECHGFHDGKSWHKIKPGKNRDGYWTNADLVEQLKKVIPIFEAAHPNCILLFGFDNSQNHHAKNPDALTTAHLNLKDGGASDKFPLRATVNPTTGEPQAMQLDDGVTQKGMKRILEERQCWPAGGLTVAAAKALLDSHPDFQESRIWLQEVVEEAGHIMIFYPKFHCELNYIEMIWAWVKRDLRQQCTFSFPDLEARLPIALNSVPISYFKKVSRHCFRFMDGYRSGLVGPELDYAVRQYKGHRQIPADMINHVKAEYAAEQERKRRKTAH